MSTNVFPTFNINSIGYPVKRTAVWNTKIQDSISGMETRLAYWTYPKYKWTIDLNALQAIASADDFATFMGFYNARQGQFDTWLYSDPDDGGVAGQNIGTGTGGNANFQLVKAFGGFVEPVLAPNTVTAVYLGGLSIPTAGLSTPTNGALTSTSGGSLTGATYYVRSTWVTNSGETLAATETSLAVASNKVLNVAAPSSAPTGAIGWNVYVSTATGTETRQNGNTPVATGTAWVEPTSGLVSGAALPGANTTGWSVALWGSTNPGLLTFAGNVNNNIVVTADFSYYYPCRFLTDNMDFDLIYKQMYQAKKITWQSVKN